MRKKLGSIRPDSLISLYGQNAGWRAPLSHIYTITKDYSLIFVIAAGSGNQSGLAYASISTTASSYRQLINTTVGYQQDGTNLALSALMIEDAKAGNTITMSAGQYASAWIFAVE